MTLSWMSARRAASMHRWFWPIRCDAGAPTPASFQRVGTPTAALVGAVLALASACDTNGPLFTSVNPNSPVIGADAAPPGDDAEPMPEPMDDPSEPGLGQGGSNPSVAGAGGTPGSGAGAASGSGGPSEELPGDAGAAGSGGGAGPGGAGGVGAGGGAGAQRPPNDFSCGNVCLRRGGRCFEGTCHFDCDEPGSCGEEQIICPAGQPCEVRCGDRACADNVICSLGAQCNIACEGEGSCADQVICEGECNVSCSGPDSCRSGIGGAVDLLQLECSGVRSCAATVSCEGQDCQLECSGPRSCARVRTLAVDNVVTCSGPGSCAGDFICLGATCDYSCADDACVSGVDCRALSCDQSDY